MLVLFILLFFRISSSYGKLLGDHICQTEITEPKEVTKWELRNKTVRTYQWCMNVPPRCSVYYNKLVNETQTSIFNITKTVETCCEGFQEQNNFCVSLCEECTNGLCLRGSCICQNGWEGPNCSSRIPNYEESTTKDSPFTTNRHDFSTVRATNQNPKNKTAIPNFPNHETYKSVPIKSISESATTVVKTTTQEILNSSLASTLPPTSEYMSSENSALITNFETSKSSILNIVEETSQSEISTESSITSKLSVETIGSNSLSVTDSTLKTNTHSISTPKQTTNDNHIRFTTSTLPNNNEDKAYIPSDNNTNFKSDNDNNDKNISSENSSSSPPSLKATTLTTGKSLQKTFTGLHSSPHEPINSSIETLKHSLTTLNDIVKLERTISDLMMTNNEYKSNEYEANSSESIASSPPSTPVTILSSTEYSFTDRTYPASLSKEMMPEKNNFGGSVLTTTYSKDYTDTRDTPGNLNMDIDYREVGGQSFEIESGSPVISQNENNFSESNSEESTRSYVTHNIRTSSVLDRPTMVKNDKGIFDHEESAGDRYLKRSFVDDYSKNSLLANDTESGNNLAYSVGAAAATTILIIIIAVSVLAIKSSKKKMRNNIEKKEVATVAVYTTSIFHSPLPDPPNFDNPTYISTGKSNDWDGQTGELMEAKEFNIMFHKPQQNSNIEFKQYLYDHPPSTGSYRASSDIDALSQYNTSHKSGSGMIILEPLYDEIPSRDNVVNENLGSLRERSAGEKTDFTDVSHSSVDNNSLYVNTFGRTMF